MLKVAAAKRFWNNDAKNTDKDDMEMGILASSISKYDDQKFLNSFQILMYIFFVDLANDESISWHTVVFSLATSVEVVHLWVEYPPLVALTWIYIPVNVKEDHLKHCIGLANG